MGKNKRFQPKKDGNYRRGKKLLESKKDGTVRKQFLVFSLKDLDKSQGEKFEKWEEFEILAKALNRIHGFCRMILQEAKKNNNLIKVYGKGLPPNSKFKHPHYLY